MRTYLVLLAVVGMFASSLVLLPMAQGQESPPKAATKTAPADDRMENPPPTEPSNPTAPTPETDSEVRILRPDMPLKPGRAFVSGAAVMWTENVAHVTSEGDQRAFIRYENMTLEADDIWTDLKELLRAVGNVRLTVDQEITYADEMVFNLKTKKGLAYGGAAYGAPWYYQGYQIERVSEKESLIRNGRLTTSSLKYPHTYFRASKILVHLDKEIIAKHVVFMIGGVPLLYIPAYRRSLRERRPATIIVKLGSDTFQGTWASVIVPLARRQRLRSVLQFDYATLRGMGQGFETTYHVRDVHLQSIKITKPEGATPEEITLVRRKAQEVGRRLRGDYNHVRVRRLFLPFQIRDEDIARARSTAEDVLKALKEGGDFGKLARQYSSDDETKRDGGVLGYLAPGDGLLPPSLEKVALSLDYGEVSSLIQTPDGFYLFRVNDVLEFSGHVEKQVQMIYIAVEANDDAKEATRELAEELTNRAKSGEDFLALITKYGGPLPRSAWTEVERKSGISAAPTEIWVPKIEFTDYNQRRFLDRANPGDISKPFEVREGLLILQRLEEEKTPDFTELAREVSDDESAERGGDIGFVGKTDVPRKVYNTAVGLDKGEVSRYVETDDAFYVVKSVGRRTLQGEVSILRKDIYSYGRTETFRIGQQWDVLMRHQQDIPTKWDRKGRRFAFWSRVDYRSRDFKKGTFGRNQADLRTFAVFTFDSNPTTVDEPMPSFRSRLTVDKTFSFVEERGGTVQRLPEATFTWSGDLYRVYGFRQLHNKLRKIARRVEKWEVPILKFPTLESTRFTLDGSLANLFRDRFRYMESIRKIREARGLGNDAYDDVYLKTVDLGLDLSKATQIDLTSTRNVILEMGGSGQVVWHEKDQKGNRNILRGVFSSSFSASNLLFRVYNIGWVPGASRLRHEMKTQLSFDWAPSVNDREEDPNNPDPNAVKLYPFGSSTYLFERKYLALTFSTNVQIKTRMNKTINALTLTLRTSRDYTQRRALYNRKWEFLTGRLVFSPLASGNLSGTMNASWDPNTYPPGSSIQRPPWALVSFASNVHYRSGDFRRGWSFDIGTQYQRLTRRSTRNFVFGFEWRPSTLFGIDVNTRFDYDRYRIENPRGFRANALAQALGVAYLHPSAQQITIRRNLRDWDLRIIWRRTGSIGNVRKEFTYQINLIADPTLTIGVGYDAVTNRWGLRSLPIGVPPTFTGGSLGRSRF